MTQNPITIVIPTLKKEQADIAGEQALATALCPVIVNLIVSVDPGGQGFTKTANDGIRMVDETHDICLLNDDVFYFQWGWLELLRRGLYHTTRHGITAPTGASGTAPMKNAGPGLSGLQVVDQVPFWCALFKRDMLDDLGLLDEAFIHYASDNWYCYVMRKKGWKCVWVKSAFLGHRKHGSGRQNKWREHDHRLYWKRRKRAR